MQAAPAKEQYPESILTVRQAIVLFCVLATFTADAVSILFVMGRFNLWEAAVTLFTVMALSAGTICTVLWIPQSKS